MLIPVIPFALAFAGLHPAVAIALVAGAMNPDFLGIASPLLVIALLAGAAMVFLFILSLFY